MIQNKFTSDHKFFLKISLLSKFYLNNFVKENPSFYHSAMEPSQNLLNWSKMINFDKEYEIKEIREETRLKYLKVILLDVDRTHTDLVNKEELTDLLLHNAEHFEDLNYYQGLNSISFFLLNFIKDSVKCKKVLMHISEQILVPNFKNSFKHFRKLLYIYNSLCKLLLPEVYGKLSSLNISSR